MFVYFCLGGSLLLVVVDFLLKKLVVRELMPIGCYELWPDVLHFTYHQNTGAAFSMLSDSTRLLIALTSILLTLIVGYMLLKKPKNKWVCVSLMLIVAGGLGNLIDRVVQGYVVDYIDFTLIDFAVFNFADICAVCGTIMLAAYFIFEDVVLTRKKKVQPIASETEENHV